MLRGRIEVFSKTLITALVATSILLSIDPVFGTEFKIATLDSDEARPVARRTKILYETIGHSAKVSFLPARRSLAEVNAGRRDAEMARIAGLEKEYPNLVRVPEPIYFTTYSAVVRKDSGIESTSWGDLKSQKIARAMGIQILRIRTRDYMVEAVPSPKSIVKMVERGRVNVGLMLTSDAERFVAPNGELKILKPQIEDTVLYHYVHKRHVKIVPALDKALKEMRKDGLLGAHYIYAF